MYEIFEKLCQERGITPYRFCKDTGINSSTISTWKDLSSLSITPQDERDIARDMKSIREKLLSGANGPLSYDGEPIPEDDAELLLGQIELMMRKLKPINKEKYNPNKNKK